MKFEWYEELLDSNHIEQGDFIPKCPIMIPPSQFNEGDEIEVDVELIDSIILSQSCDLVNEKIQIVLVCPYMSLSSFLENLPESQRSNRATKKNIDNLRKGHLPGYHLLNKSKKVSIDDYLVVDFRNVYGIKIENLRNIAIDLGNRIRLLPPYREHLSQAFARYFMRVGLPQDIIVEGY